MDKLFESVRADQSFTQALDAFSVCKEQSLIYGITGAQKSFLLAAAYRKISRPLLIITSNAESLEPLRSDLSLLLPDTDIVELPAMDIVTFTAAAKSVELAARRMDVLGRMLRGEPTVILAVTEAVIQKTLPKVEFENSRLTLTLGQRMDKTELLEFLVKAGYERVEQVDTIGQFSARGGIVDIFPINLSNPVRLELLDDELDSLREFDAVSQRSLGNLPQLDILPVTEPEHGGALVSCLSYLPPAAAVVFDEPARIREQIHKLVKENPVLKQRTFSWSELAATTRDYGVVCLSLMLQKNPYIDPTRIVSITVRGIASFHKQMELLGSELRSWQERSFCVVLFLSTRDKALAVQRSLAEEGISAVVQERISNLSAGTIVIAIGALSSGFELTQARLTVISELDVLGRQKKHLRPRPAPNQQINYFRDINLGDYVVHVNHGIGKYVGVETLEVGGIHKDYLHIRYAGDDKLYVPTDQVHLLQKYIGTDDETPRLHKMGGSDWLKIKSKAKAAVADIAKELIALYAKRQLTAGFAFAADTPWQREFEEAFSYEDTPDQAAAVAEIKTDMETSRPMDRLLCGDVGFGKTEVAVRAAFKAVMNGKQVAVLVPTTVLAQQHYQTFRLRFADFGVKVGVISRFRSLKEQRATVDKVSRGQVDVLIGTHRILQTDVAFKDIGLLIVDEEQRFGVVQKEKLKRWAAGIDVLTLSATPIPRTLHMSLVGARDMSIIETPPENRFPVQTYVVEYQDNVIRDAIKRELKRGGQVYFVYNRVQTIDKMVRQLSEMLPDAKIKSAHGQMPEELLEQIMLDFYEGHEDVLVCTSIIENGLDVSNANTIIVYDADRFGLSQLYQMRGRVGRSHRMAFAYFTYRRDKVLTEVAEKRLQAIKDFTELGSGFKIAMRDLEIRGAGNILGAQQHGHIVNVGFEMYCRMLDEAVRELKHGAAAAIPAEPVLELNTEAYISGEYISDAMHKIEVYQRVAAIRTQQHISDLLDELVDRFGEPPVCVLNLLTVARIKNAARTLGLRSVLSKAGHFELIFGDNPHLDISKLMAVKDSYPNRVAMFPGPPETIHLKTMRLPEKSLLEWLLKMLEMLLS